MSGTNTAISAIEARLLAAGAPFELCDVRYLGETVRTYANRPPDLRSVLARTAAFGERPYAIFANRDGERRIAYADLVAIVASVASVLRTDYGVGPGDRVAILGENRAEWLLTFWATISIGAVAVGLNGWWTGDEIRYALDDCAPKVLVADEKRLARLAGTAPSMPVVVMERDFARLESAHRGAPLPTNPIAPEDAAIILYSSGTTGRPKGAVHTHFNVTSMIMTSFFHGARMHGVLGITPGVAVTLVTSPLFHVSGLHAAAIVGLAGGATTVWPMGRFDPELALTLIQRERVTGWGYTATILHRLLAFPRIAEFDTSSMRLVGGGGSPIPTTLQKRARAAIPSIEQALGVGYGLTETCAFTCLAAGEELATHPESSGRPLPGVEVEIRDASGAALPEGEDGEIFVRGPLVMREYFGNEAATRETIGPGRWLRTGDIGCLREGRIYLATRKRDLILRGGENVYPAEIEQRLEEHPSIAEVAVVGVDHAELGHEVKAIVVPKAGAEIDVGALSAHVASSLAYFKVPSLWEIRSEPLPRNATGKVVKFALLEGGPAQFIEE